MKAKSPFRVGFVGFGKMAQAIWEGMTEARLVANRNITFCEKSPVLEEMHSENYGIPSLPLKQLVTSCDVIVFCVKPQSLDEVLADFPRENLASKCLISILAGIPIARFQAQLGRDIQMVRAMPNTPALVGAGMTALAFENVSDAFRDFAISLFSSFGEAHISDESELDVVTGISGSGPAFMYRIADQIAKMGRTEGLSYPVALKLVAQTMVGAGKMLLHSSKTPAQLIQDVSSPGGTTVAGLNYFDQTDIDKEIQNVVKRAIDRARELGKHTS